MDKELFLKIHEVSSLCDKYRLRNYIVNPDLAVDVDDNVDLYNIGLVEIPIKFGKVNGYFDISENELTNLENSPYFIGGHFICTDNKLTSLEYCPKEIGGYMDVSGNYIEEKHFIDGPDKLLHNIKINDGGWITRNYYFRIKKGLKREIILNKILNDNR